MAHDKNIYRDENFPAGEKALGKSVNFSAMCTGLSPSQLISPLRFSLEKH
jgi:hypothetical protein